MVRKAKLGREFSKPIGVRPRPLPHLEIEVREPVPGMITSEYEARCWIALRRLGYTPQLQVPFRGGTEFAGGMRVDFVLPTIRTVVRVQSWWHNDPDVQLRDEYGRTYLQAQGFIVVDVPGDELETVDAMISWLRRQLGRPTA